MAPQPNPDLIEVFKASDPGTKLLADKKQLRAKEGKLIRWTDREEFLGKGNGKGKKEAKKTDATKTEDPPAGEPAKGADDPEARKALVAEAEAAGVAVHHRMTNETLRKKIDEAKAKATA